ncbi:cytochrome c3 family protein [uncultured Parasutterella sp.]|jgi:hypothetical protein|uniref:cytochrome c3 family protein n=1 Tax=uncultured Parasutterella sp. TaxID=1263098 RepID=UPI0025B4AB51|nr:cytochrome c3 family protein [uncultured Parasutterella sp.]
MKTILKTSVLLCSLIFAAAASAKMPQMSKHAQRNIQCTGCHQNGTFAPVPTAQCVTCHNQDQLAKSTERLNYTSRMKNPKTGEVKEHIALVNPHDSYHFGRTEDCTDCHREHRASVNDCATCHDVKAWNMKDPK